MSYDPFRGMFHPGDVPPPDPNAHAELLRLSEWGYRPITWLWDRMIPKRKDTGDQYKGLDRFGRVKDSRWVRYHNGTPGDLDRIKYGYDRASNRIWRENPVAAGQSTQFDELYAHDGLHRLKDMQRGTLDSQHSALNSTTFGQCWTLDATGNWKGFRQDDDGDGTWDLAQERTANGVNEITGVTEAAGPSWATPGYDAAGNTTAVPKPADPTTSYTATYDAWNRLVKLEEPASGSSSSSGGGGGPQTVQENQYDARRYRTVRKDYADGALSETRHFYYTEQWQSVEERVGTSSDPERQHVWGLRYIDDLVRRDRDTNGDGDLDESLYALQDANWNMTGVVSSIYDALERYAYTAYGDPAVLDEGFAARSGSDYGWDVLYAGYRWDGGTGLYAVRNRTYQPGLGTWLHRDPLGNVSTTNLYEYVKGRVFDSVDPKGLEVAGYAHPYPLSLGGSQYQPRFYLDEASHTAFHDYFRDLYNNAGVATNRGYGDNARDYWKNDLTRAQQHEHIKNAMRRAGIPEADINKHWDDITNGANPGILNDDKYHRGARIGGHKPRAKLGRLRRAAGAVGRWGRRVCVVLGIISAVDSFAEGAQGEGHHEGQTGVLPGVGNAVHDAVMGDEVEWAFQQGMEAGGRALRLERLPENDCRRAGSGSGVPDILDEVMGRQ